MARVGGVYLLAGTALASPIRVGWAGLASPIALGGPTRVGWTGLASPVGLAGPTRIGANYKFSIQSVNRAFYLNRLDGGQLFDQFRFVYETNTQIIPEHNPYRPRLPEQLIRLGDDYYDFSEENQQILREQHNITQAGDTTFPYQLTIKGHDDQLYKLGSIGRFYHEDYGVILARYVQFDGMIDTVETACCPVGLHKKATSLNWVVTNNLEKSDPNLVVGISAPFLTPTDGQYGWVIVNGAILQQVKNTSASAEIGESFVWSASGEVSNAAEGKILGYRVNRLEENPLRLLSGQMLVQLESMSVGSITALITDQLEPIQTQLTDLQNALSQVPSSTAITSLNSKLTLLQNQLTAEIDSRKQVDLAIQDQLASLNLLDADGILTTTANNLEAAVSALQTQIDAIRVIALDALDKANQALTNADSGLQEQISLILEQLAEEISRPKGRFPVVDGSIPPNLVYLPDGSLVYVETF